MQIQQIQMEKIFQVIQKYHMIEPGMKVIAGVSGGADSVCLLYVLNQYRKCMDFELQAVHVEHGIRGEESLADAQFTEDLCRSMGVPCQLVHVSAQEAAEQRKMSLEEAGRLLRYETFEARRIQWNADRIAVAHNENDQAETVLWNLVRGSGLRGLGGIRPVRERIIRPLLFTSRREIEEILQNAGLSWRTDRTNLETDYTRNKIRLAILPLLEKELNSRASAHLAETAQRMQELQEYVDWAADAAAETCIRKEGCDFLLLLKEYSQAEPLIQKELLKRMLQECGGLKDVGAVHLNMLECLTAQDCGKECHLPGRVRAVREDGIIRLQKSGDVQKENSGEGQEGRRTDYSLPPQSVPDLELPVPGTVHWGGWQIETSFFENHSDLQAEIMAEKKYTKWISYDIINGNVRLRTRRSGDYLIVNADGGRKKLKDYFIDRKIPRDKRDQIWLLADGSHVLWAVGGRISEAAKVSRQTKYVLRIQMKEDSK